MKKILFMCLIVLGFMFSSCATIMYGPTYTAKVVVTNSQNTEIYVNNEYKGVDSVSFQWKRKLADNINITLREQNYDDQTFTYNTKDIAAGTIIGNVILVGLIPGLIVDGITGSWYKPDTGAISIKQLNSQVYLYELIYNRRQIKKKEENYDVKTYQL